MSHSVLQGSSSKFSDLDRRALAIGVLAGSKTNNVLVKLPAKKGFWKLAVWPAAASLLIGAGIYQPWKMLPSESAADAINASDTLRTVTIDRPSPAGTANVVLPATVRPWQVATLNARVNGYLIHWHADLGARVRAGDLLAEIETPELDQEIAEGQAQVGEAIAATTQSKAERTEAEADLKAAEAQLVRVRAETELARTQRTRSEKLVRTRALSQEDFDTSSTQLEVRAADVTATEAGITRRRRNLETRDAIINAREATAKSRQANVDRLKELQAFRRIVAPFDGVITKRTAQVGMLVTAGKDPLFVIEDMNRVRVQLNVPQTYSLQARPGVVALVSLPESSGRIVKATITRVADSVDSTNRTMLAEIELENSSRTFQPGSYAQVTLTTPQIDPVWSIPTNTLAMRVDGPHVAVVDAKNKIEIRRVNLGRDLGSRVIVAEGIRGDERLIVNPGDDLAAGSEVRISKGGDSVREMAQR